MKKRKRRWLKVLLVLLLIVVMSDLTVRLMLLKVEKTSSQCLMIPTRFVQDYPECAQRLIEVANVTNVRIVANGTLNSESTNQTIFRFHHVYGYPSPSAYHEAAKITKLYRNFLGMPHNYSSPPPAAPFSLPFRILQLQ